MSQAVPTSVTGAGAEPAPHVTETPYSRSLIVGGRLMMGANITLQSSFLFAYLYLRANNFGGMWRSGVGPPAIGVNTLVMIIPVIAAGGYWLAVQATRSGEREPVTRALGLALLLSLATIAIRFYQLYQTGWDLSAGAYVDISVAWLAVLLAEFALGVLLTVAMFMGHVRRTVAASAAQVMQLWEYWIFVTGVAVFVYLLIQFVN